MNPFSLQTKIEYLKGVGPTRGKALREELGIETCEDLINHFPFRYIDKTQFHKIASIDQFSGSVQLRGRIQRFTTEGVGRKQRLKATFRDDTGSIQLIWFKRVQWVQKTIVPGVEYILYGKPNFFKGRPSIAHPELDPVTEANTQQAASLEPVYHTTGKLESKNLDARGLRKLQKLLVNKIKEIEVADPLPDYLKSRLRLPSKKQALLAVHFPRNYEEQKVAADRLKFEELFFLQIRLLMLKSARKAQLKGHVFGTIGDYFNRFFSEKLPFELTGAQKRVLKEIRRDLGTGRQMNRLLQGDVGSGKTIVGFMTMLMAMDNGFQACLMAPTEILAQQHYHSIAEMAKGLGIQVGFLSGSVKGKKRKAILEALVNGDLHILIGTHALIEDWVVFQRLGLVIIDEQHRFGVEQRSRLWRKGADGLAPHVLVMTATPIPRTLAMTLYGDLDISVIDELPPGRKEIQTLHFTENKRMRLFGFMREQIALGRQVYVVYPLIEESESEQLAELNNLTEGYEALSREFPMPDYHISVVNGRQKPADKDFEMQRFVKGETQIMVATTVIEVGVNVPNASVMVIENTERFGLSQLHQLRGRVGRGAAQSYCILMSSFKLSKESRKRIETMVGTNDGFKIAEVDLQLRGPGNIEGKQQSGMISLRIADLSKDGRILQTARELAMRILEDDPKLEKSINQEMKAHILAENKKRPSWGMIS
ncbi:MAG: ATP-dependent DNA helicase RecG [Bacteroidota bacterium]